MDIALFGDLYAFLEIAWRPHLSDQIYFSNSKYPDPGLTGLVTSHTRPAPAIAGVLEVLENLSGKVSVPSTIFADIKRH